MTHSVYKIRKGNTNTPFFIYKPSIIFKLHYLLTFFFFRPFQFQAILHCKRIHFLKRNPPFFKQTFFFFISSYSHYKKRRWKANYVSQPWSILSVGSHFLHRTTWYINQHDIDRVSRTNSQKSSWKLLEILAWWANDDRSKSDWFRRKSNDGDL